MASVPNDRVRLRQNIEAFQAEVVLDPDGFRDIPLVDGEPALATLTREVDQIILPRILRFKNDRQDEIALRVVSRRITAVEQLSTHLAGAAAALLDNHEFTDPKSPEANLLASVLEDFAANTKQLRVCTTLSQQGISASNVGVPLSAILSNTTGDDGGIDKISLSSLLDTCKSISDGYLVTQGQDIISRHGDKDAVQRLEQLFASEVSKAKLATKSDQCVILGSGQPSDQAIMRAVCEGKTYYLKAQLSKILDTFPTVVSKGSATL